MRVLQYTGELNDLAFGDHLVDTSRACCMNELIYEIRQSKKATNFEIPTIWNSGKGKSREAIKDHLCQK